MPFKSKKQMRFIAYAEKIGKVKKGTFKEFLSKTKNIKNLKEGVEKSNKNNVYNKREFYDGYIKIK